MSGAACLQRPLEKAELPDWLKATCNASSRQRVRQFSHSTRCVTFPQRRDARSDDVERRSADFVRVRQQELGMHIQEPYRATKTDFVVSN